MGFTGAIAASAAGAMVSSAMADDGGGGGGQGGGGSGGGYSAYGPQVDTNLYKLMQDYGSRGGNEGLMYTPFGQNDPRTGNQWYNEILQMVNLNPYTAALQTGAERAGGLAGTASENLSLGAQGVRDYASAMQPRALDILNMGFDPRSELYQRTQQQLQDQTRASLAARGMNPTGVGAGVENKAMSDFNIDWQNQQLARGLSALGGYGTSMGQYGAAQGQAGQLDSAAIQSMIASGQIPYDVYRGRAADLVNFTNATQTGQLQALQPMQNLAAMYGNYLGFSNQAAQTANQAQQYGQNRADQAGAGITGMLGPALGQGLDYLWNSGGGGVPPGGYSTGGYSALPQYLGGYDGGSSGGGASDLF